MACPNSPRPKKAREVKSIVKSMLIIFITKNSPWQVKQSIPHTTVMFYGEYVIVSEDFAPNFGDNRTGYFIMITHRLTLPFSLGNL
jgi:hypothetical protein